MVNILFFDRGWVAALPASGARHNPRRRVWGFTPPHVLRPMPGLRHEQQTVASPYRTVSTGGTAGTAQLPTPVSPQIHGSKAASRV